MPRLKYLLELMTPESQLLLANCFYKYIIIEIIMIIMMMTFVLNSNRLINIYASTQNSQIKTGWKLNEILFFDGDCF